jgi:hypothetical protein
VGCRGVEDDERRPGPHLVDDAVRDLADQSVGYGHEDDVGPGQGLVLLDAVSTRGRLQALASLLGDLDMIDLEARAPEIGGKAHAHLPAGAEQGDSRHPPCSPFLPARSGSERGAHEEPACAQVPWCVASGRSSGKITGEA